MASPKTTAPGSARTPTRRAATKARPGDAASAHTGAPAAADGPLDRPSAPAKPRPAARSESKTSVKAAARPANETAPRPAARPQTPATAGSAAPATRAARPRPLRRAADEPVGATVHPMAIDSGDRLRPADPAVAVLAAPAPHRPAVDLHLRHHAIAEAAYLTAERRGFAPGFELDDWLQAEAAYEARARRD